jgi:hypothetical protein
MKVKEVVEKLKAMQLDDCELLIALPGGRFSAVTLVEPYSKMGEHEQPLKVGILYPHPRDVSGPAAAPDNERPEWVKIGDAIMDFLGGPAEKPAEGTDD